MSYKRSRATYEADLTAQQSPFVAYGTPLPPLDPEVRDDGSFVPVWKQEARDERGRKRLHGAFTGGWSAGYFNTVGSKEGWTPSTFVSSRTSRRKDDKAAVQQRPEDFMDDEDLADAEEARKIETNAAFAGLGSTQDSMSRAGALMGLFRVQGETMGTKLLRKMGWRDGQGIGPKVRRKARLDVKAVTSDKADTFLFAPENVGMISFARKTDWKGLGFEGEARMSLSGRNISTAPSDDEDDDLGSLGRPRLKAAGGKSKKAEAKPRGGIGMGILNDTGSDDEDPYEIGPRISYNRVIGGDKKKKKSTPANPAVKAKPTFLPNRAALKRVALGVRRCHDGRLPLEGFVFGREPDPLTSETVSEPKYPPPQIPPDWKSPKQAAASATGKEPHYVSPAEAARASALNPQARAALLGEKPLPGKSVFDFLSSTARERLVAATGKSDLPEAKGEVPAGHNLTDEQRTQEVLNQVPRLEKETATAAISRGASGPYGEDGEKRARYRAYLEFQAGYGRSLPARPGGMGWEDWRREFGEFWNCARIFKPMTGPMASRFTTSSSTVRLGGESSQGRVDERDLAARRPQKQLDPAEEAARLGMYGHMTRSVADFFPTRLLCKRFGVRPPAHVQPDETADSGKASRGPGQPQPQPQPQPLAIEYVSEEKIQGGPVATPAPPAPVIDASRNEALEGKRAGEEVFKAIFGDDSYDDDDDDGE